jgi:HNH endonuclease
MSLILSFDIGYASIGWCVLAADKKLPDFLGTGVVTFPTDDCLASTRRDLRRTRRHIRSTRQRIERMKLWFTHRGMLTREDLDKPGHPAPFLLAAAALQGHHTLSAWELWTVLRWYAHNRGYDGNSRWSNDQEDSEDTEKVLQANRLMEEHGTETMCETVCACLGLNPAEFSKRISSTLPYKTLNAAYPRSRVTAEVGKLMRLHAEKIPSLNAETIRLVLKSSELTPAERNTLSTAGVRLPKRYMGGLLFGQLVPRFDNRIISRCPVTWAKTYDEEIAAGKTDAQARKLADKFAKVPAAKCPEFLQYRFARILANLKANGDPLDRELRQTLWDLAVKQGRRNHSDLQKAIKAYCGDVSTNIDAYFKLHPDSEDALVFDPVMDEVRKAEGSRANLSPIWKQLSESVQSVIISIWKKGRSVSLAWMLEKSADSPNATNLDAAARNYFAGLKPKQGKPPFASFDEFLLKTTFGPKIPTGRAPYARPVLKQVVAEILAGFDATKACKASDPEKGEHKSENGILYDLGIPTSRVRQLQSERPIAQVTNNHLVRHRMLILDRLVDDILSEFKTQGNEFDQVIVEVARELKEFSGKDRQEIKKSLNAKLAQHKAAEARLIKCGITPTYSLIRKCRIAMDLNWTCPFTQRTYAESELSDLEYEHIIPRSQRLSDSMAGLVLTRKEINEAKGNRTALQFITESASDDRIISSKPYEEWVKKLKVANKESHPDDYARQNARKRLLLIERYEDKERTFTEGKLTQSSQLMKIAMGAIRLKAGLESAQIDPISGPVTAEIRKSWELTGTLALACPEIRDSDGKVRHKDEIRSLTHLHHALDAATLALAAYYFPLRQHGQNQAGKIWQALMKRRRSDDEKKFLHGLGIFDTYLRPRRDGQGNETDVRLRDLPAEVKNALARSLAECRVMQHIPADRSGAKAELTTWGVTSVEGEGEDARVSLRQQASKVENGRRVSQLKTREERAGKLLGTAPKNGVGKLKAISGAMIIGDNYGIALDPTPTVIPFHDVTARLEALKQTNGGKPIRVLRNGMLIRIRGDKYAGVWQIRSINNDRIKGLLMDLSSPGMIPYRESHKAWCKRDVNLRTALKGGVEILPLRYTGHPLKD